MRLCRLRVGTGLADTAGAPRPAQPTSPRGASSHPPWGRTWDTGRHTVTGEALLIGRTGLCVCLLGGTHHWVQPLASSSDARPTRTCGEKRPATVGFRPLTIASDLLWQHTLPHFQPLTFQLFYPYDPPMTYMVNYTQEALPVSNSLDRKLSQSTRGDNSHWHRLTNHSQQLSWRGLSSYINLV